ncbi:MAG: Major Facilitator Superfamily protein [Smithella sp. PtaU1.Bin162]|nr:MAG: Major Facilitator Superfamily protein [Smithella sp. PtaU1.Bin162]
MEESSLQSGSLKSKTYHCGTLTYTKVGLFALFTWMLWGDFCLTLMESVVPSILPLKLKSLGASNWLIGMIMSTLPGVLTVFLCPWISFKSDRYRSKWGRRIPFILWTLPFLCICLVMLGLCDDITAWLRSVLPDLRGYSPAAVTIVLIAAFMIMFQFFNMFVGSVFCCLLNDVVPPSVMGRFLGTFRIVGMSAGTLYNVFIFKYAESHMKAIFIGAALVYLAGVGMMCIRVKEGEYPPIEGETDKDNKGWGGIRTFLKESFVHKFYWMKFLSTTFVATANVVNTFLVFLYQNMELSLDQIGKQIAVAALSIMAATYFMSIFIDRWHPLRIWVYGAVFGTITSVMNLMWLFIILPGNYFFWLNIGNIVISSFLMALVGVAAYPAEMRLFPQSRFGQFSSAQALIRSLFTTFMGILAGLFIDMCKKFCGCDYAYRFLFVWQLVFMLLSAVFLVLVYRMWNEMGGVRNFHPPAPWSPQGVEELPIVPVIGPQSKYLKISFLIYDAIMLISILSIPFLMFQMHLRGQLFAFRWFGLIVLPLTILVGLYWWISRNKMNSDIAEAQAGRIPRNGILHHGMLIMIGCKFLLLVGLGICQVLCALYLEMEEEAVVFGIANTVINLMLIIACRVMCRIERGFSIKIDETYVETA